MKNCPFCKAEIEDNARFCLYCMTPLNQKEVITPRKPRLLWWPFAVVGVLLFALVVLLLPGKKTPQEATASATMPTATITTASTEIPTAEPTAYPTGAPAGETTASSTAESTSPTENTETSATEAESDPTGTQTTKPRPTLGTPNSRPTTVPTYKPVSGSTSAPTYKPATGSTSAPTYKPATGATSTPTYKPATGSTSTPTYKPATGSTTTPTYKPATGSTSTPTYKPATGSTSAPTSKPTTGSTTAPTSRPTTGSTTTPTSKPTTGSTTTPTTNPTSAPTTKPTTAPTTAPTTKPTTAPTTAPTTPPPATGDVSKLPQYSWDDPVTSTYFRYRPAVQADVLGLDYQVTGNDIVITKIEDLNLGFVTIPSYIDGKQVIALAYTTFHEVAPEAIYLPKNLLALHSGVLLDFRPYLYVSGEVLAIGDSTETWSKIFTTKTCVNQYGEKFSNFSRWQEWSAQTYVYRTATPSDVGDSSYQNTDGDIVITGIDMLREDYVYDIPAYIDGKKVVAIGKYALGITRALAIYVPDTVKCIGMGAFNYCVRGAEIYFRGDSIYAPSNPFDYGSYVILRCSATCRNADKGYYKDLAKGYGITWKEWNG